MEAVAHISDVREVLACRPEYWEIGRRRLTEDVVAAAAGLLDGGASEVILLDNHGSGNPWNVLLGELPAGCVRRAGMCLVFLVLVSMACSRSVTPASGRGGVCPALVRPRVAPVGRWRGDQ